MSVRRDDVKPEEYSIPKMDGVKPNEYPIHNNKTCYSTQKYRFIVLSIKTNYEGLKFYPQKQNIINK